MSLFDRLSRILSAAEAYQDAVGAACNILLLDGRCFTSAGQQALACPLCRECSSIIGEEGARECAGIHLFSAYQAERFGGRYVYLCPMSLLHWCTPLLSEGMLAGAMVAGPVRVTPVDQFLINEITTRFSAAAGGEEELRKILERVPQTTPNRTENLSRLLYFTTLANLESEATELLANEEAFRQQTNVGEYIHHLKSMEGDKNSDLRYPLEDERRLQQAISAGRKEEALQILHSLLATVLSSRNANLEMVKSRVLELVVLLSRAAMEGGADVEQIFGLNYRYLNRIRTFTSFEELSNWLSRIINSFTDLVFNLQGVRHKDTILRAVRFMKENFYEKLSLADVSGHVGLSPQYFSRLFSSEVGTSFVDYLNTLRIQEARRLLLTSHARLGDIAYACGFEDQSYFNRIFKKLVGCPPSIFRQQHRPLEQSRIDGHAKESSR